MRPLPRLLFLLLAIALPASAQQLITESHEVHAIEMAPATLDELGRVAVVRAAGERRERPHTSATLGVDRTNAIGASLVIAPKAAPPPIARGFQAVTDPLPGESAATALDPPDTSGAVGPQHVVGAFNDAVVAQDRSGHVLGLISSAQFWHDPTQTGKFLYDPRVGYDAASDRWVMVMLGDDVPEMANGVLFIAFSMSGDPGGLWRRFRLPVDSTGTLDGDITHLGFTADQIVVTTNTWSGNLSVATSVFTMPKSVAFSTGPLTVTAVSLSYSIDLMPITSRDSTLRFTHQVQQDGIQIFEMPPGLGSIVNSRTYRSTPSVTSNPCVQLGTNFTLDCGFPSVMSAVVRNNAIWIVEELFPYAARVWKITDSTAATYVIQPPNLAVAYPSLAVNSRGAALVGYSVMGSTIYPSAAYSYIDPAGNLSASVFLKAGEAPFKRGRWGDFSTAVVDPLDDTSFWTVQEYANTPLSASFDRWATWWSYIPIAPARPRAVHH